MDMTGEYRIAAPRQAVWAALNDPEVLRAVIPGCETLTQSSPNELEAKVKAKVGPVSASFTGKVTLSELNPPESYVISGEGSGGVAGFAKGGAKVMLAEDGPDATILTYEAKADVGGKLAQIGSRLIQGTAKKMADEFFGKFSQAVVERNAAAPAVAAPVETAPVEPEPAAAPTAAMAEPIEAAAPAAPKPAAFQPAPPPPAAPAPEAKASPFANPMLWVAILVAAVLIGMLMR